MSFAIKDACNMSVYNRGTKEPIFYTPDLNTFNLSMSGDSIFAKAKGSNKIAFDGALEGSLDVESEVIGFDQLAVILSSKVVEASARVGKRQALATDSQKKVTLTGVTPVVGSISVFSLESDKKSHKEKLTFTNTSTGGSTEITITTSGFTTGETVAVYYLQEMPKTKKIVVKSESTAPNYTIYGDAYCKDENGVNQVLAIRVPNCKAKRSIELGFTAENPSTFKTTFDVLPDENGDYFELAFIGDEASSMAKFMNETQAISVGDGEDIKVKTVK